MIEEYALTRAYPHALTDSLVISSADLPRQSYPQDNHQLSFSPRLPPFRLISPSPFSYTPNCLLRFSRQGPCDFLSLSLSLSFPLSLSHSHLTNQLQSGDKTPFFSLHTDLRIGIFILLLLSSDPTLPPSRILCSFLITGFLHQAYEDSNAARKGGFDP